jgi:hypothetical protein
MNNSSHHTIKHSDDPPYDDLLSYFLFFGERRILKGIDMNNKNYRRKQLKWSLLPHELFGALWSIMS